MPSLRADIPHQLWSWDTTYLRQSHQHPLDLNAENGNAIDVHYLVAIARRNARIKARRAECAALVLQAEGQQRQSVLAITVLHRQVSTGFPGRSFASKAEACEWVTASSSLCLTNATAELPSQSAGSAPRSTQGLARPTQNAGANPLAAGASQ